MLLRRNIPCTFVDGWSVVTYDNHDRSKVLLKGEDLFKIDHTTHIPARVHHILTHTHNAEDSREAFYLPLPPYTIDFNLINIICAGLTLPFHYNPLPFHPFIHSVQLDIPKIHTAHTGVLIHAHDITFFSREKLTTLILSDTIICLITSQAGLPIENDSPPIDIPPDTIIVHTAGNWARGHTSLSHVTQSQ
jgi:hypothetical protein